MRDARRDHGVGWPVLGGAGDTNRLGWAELASKPHTDQRKGGDDRPADQDQQPRASQRADIALGLAGHEHHQQQREHKAQLAGGQYQRLTDDGSPGRPGFLWPHPPGWRGLQPPMLQQTTLLLATDRGFPPAPGLSLSRRSHGRYPNRAHQVRSVRQPNDGLHRWDGRRLLQ